MNAYSGMYPIVWAYFLQMPYYAVYIIGICLCLSRWRRHPKVCAMAMAGFSLLFIESLVGTLFSSYILPQMLRDSGRGGMWTYYLIWLLRGVLHASFWVFILLAIFGWRSGTRYDVGKRSGN